MSNKNSGIKRRRFLQILGTAGMGSMLGNFIKPAVSQASISQASEMRVGTRPFGRTGIQVPVLSLGTMFDTGANQLLLRQAVKWGVTYWDTAQYYNRWGSEPGIGKYLAKYPEDRKKIFLVSKSIKRDPKELTLELEDSLNNLKTDYLDLFFIHAVENAGEELTPQIKIWAEKMKSRGKIRLFGFSTHANMDKSLSHAATIGWVDGIMTTYNYKVMTADKMKKAIDACHKAGIGLTAMKTQAFSSWGGLNLGEENTQSQALEKRFIDKGLTKEQARLLAVWSDERIASVCSQMNTLAILKANIQAAVSTVRLNAGDHHCFETVAQAGISNYCAGCTDICQPMVDQDIPVGKIMRCLMYSNSYHDHSHARMEFQDIPHGLRTRLADFDYSLAQSKCPRNLPIGRLMARAVKEFS